MCMLLIKPQGVTLPPIYFDSLWRCNPDGLATYCVETGELFKTLDKTVAFEHLESSHDVELVVHFRLGASGDSLKDQLHGFSVCMDEWLLFHNGVLSSVYGVDGMGLSDTQVLATLFRDKTLQELVDYVEKHEKWSRFLLVSKLTGEYVIPNCAEWDGKATINDKLVTFSNTTAIDRKLLDKKAEDISLADRKRVWESFTYETPVNTIESKPVTKSLIDSVVSDKDIVDMIEACWADPQACIQLIAKKPHVAYSLLSTHFGESGNELPF